MIDPSRKPKNPRCLVIGFLPLVGGMKSKTNSYRPLKDSFYFLRTFNELFNAVICNINYQNLKNILSHKGNSQEMFAKS